GFATHRELTALVAAGMTPYDALRTGTYNPAAYFCLEGQLGPVTQEATADLMLLRENPLLDIANTQTIDGVMLRGRWLNRDDLDRVLARYDREASE
ncbi:MAG: amidohydrolase family protein, partial [Pseudomonadota bacterium]